VSPSLQPCPYCGRLSGPHSRLSYRHYNRPAINGAHTCYAHRDLPALDFMAELRRLVANDDARIERAITEQYR
jgi:hypothetical protein